MEVLHLNSSMTLARNSLRNGRRAEAPVQFGKYVPLDHRRSARLVKIFGLLVTDYGLGPPYPTYPPHP
jgi:hypothetical protein